MSLDLETVAKQLTDSGIIALTRLENFLPPRANPGSADELVDQLLKGSQLTPFQAEQVRAGKAGGLVLGDYLILDRIGAGGMGQVFKAEHRLMKRRVAVKMLPPGKTDASAVARFRREVEAAARLAHPNIVAAHDAAEINGVVILVMEYVEGSTLSAIVRKRGPPPVATAVRYVLQAARGLQFAHAAGVIHRDVKPSNLLVDRSGTVKILDLGLARLDTDNASEEDLTGTGAVMGTVDYMAPEQARSSKLADARADIYSLGCVLCYLITGHTLYEGECVIDRLLAHRETPIPSLAAANAAVSAHLDTTFRRMVAKQPADRYQSMSEVITDLEQVGSAPLEVTSTFVRLPDDPTDSSDPDKAPSGGSSLTRPTDGWRVGSSGHFSLSPTKRIVAGVLLALVFASGLIAFNKYKFSAVAGSSDLGESVNALSAAVREPGSGPPATVERGSPDLRAALWALSLGGSVQVQFGEPRVTRDLAHAAELPSSAFRLIGITIPSNPGLTDDDLQHLAGLQYLSNLDLHGTKVGDRGMSHLRSLPSLRSLSLHHTKISDDALDHVRELKNLFTLILTETNITSAGLESLASLSRLTTLDLGGCRVTDAGLQHLKGLKQLSHLGLQFTRVSPRGLAWLPNLPQLSFLDVSGVAIDDQAVEELVRMKSLKVLVLVGSRMSAASQEKLKAALPGCQLRRQDAAAAGTGNAD